MTVKHLRKSRTIWFGVMVMLLSIAELAEQHLPALLVDMTPKANAWITLGIGVLIIVLRFVTRGPVTWRSTDADL